MLNFTELQSVYMPRHNVLVTRCMNYNLPSLNRQPLSPPLVTGQLMEPDYRIPLQLVFQRVVLICPLDWFTERIGLSRTPGLCGGKSVYHSCMLHIY
jgi:hypothetical protein